MSDASHLTTPRVLTCEVGTNNPPLSPNEINELVVENMEYWNDIEIEPFDTGNYGGSVRGKGKSRGSCRGGRGVGRGRGLGKGRGSRGGRGKGLTPPSFNPISISDGRKSLTNSTTSQFQFMPTPTYQRSWGVF